MCRIVFIIGCLLVALSIAPLSLDAQGARPGSAAEDAGLLPILISTPGVSGFESDVRELLATGRVAGRRVDEAGNLVVTIGQGKPHLLVCTNMDEDGYFVSGITDAGYLRVHRVTTGVTNRLFEQMHYGQPMFVRTSTGTHVPGVFVTASTHLQRGRAPDAAPKSVDDLWVDVGADTRAGVLDLGVQVLDPVSLRERVQPLAGERMAGVAAQTRGGDAALDMLLAAYQKRDPKINGTVTIAWAAQGAFGERGMARLAQEIDAETTRRAPSGSWARACWSQTPTRRRSRWRSSWASRSKRLRRRCGRQTRGRPRKRRCWPCRCCTRRHLWRRWTSAMSLAWPPCSVPSPV
jgi:hypothetical protein